jgi:hypothetical protein
MLQPKNVAPHNHSQAGSNMLLPSGIKGCFSDTPVYDIGDSIAEALRMFRTWNPDWQPRYVMADKSDAEKNALTAVFPESTLLLCDFHRLQAWWRWINDSQHGVGDKAK